MIDFFYYFFVILLFVYSAEKYRKNPTVVNILKIALPFSFFLALRHVPGDSEFYESFYQGHESRDLEYGWRFLVDIFNSFGASLLVYKWIAVYFLQVLFFLCAIRREWYSLLPLFCLFYCFMGIESGSNIMRHWLACCIMLYAYTHFRQSENIIKDYLRYAFFLIIACSVHKSAYLALLFPLLYSVRTPDKRILIIFLLICFFTTGFFSELWIYLSFILNENDSVYSYYVNNFGLEDVQLRSGIGRLYYLVESCLVLWFFPKDKKASENKTLNALFLIYFIGMCLVFIFGAYADLARIAFYYSCCQVVILPIIVKYLINRKENFQVLIGYSIIIARVLLFCSLFFNKTYGVCPISF